MRYWKAILSLVALLALGSALAPGAEAQAPKGEYKIGVLEPLTGPLAGEGKRHLEGYEIMRDIINERGGVMGKKLVFTVADAPNPTAAASEANRLITQEGVKIITGTFSSTLCGAASEAAARHNVIYWETSCVDPKFTRRGLKNVFRTEIDGTGFGWYMIEFAAKHLAPKLNMKPNQFRVVFLSEDSSYGQGVTESARDRAKREFGMQELAAEYYNFRTINDFTPTIVKFKQLNPDIVFAISYNNDAILYWRQAKEQNFVPKAQVSAGATGYGSPDFGKAFGKDADGPFALLEPAPGFKVEALRPEGQAIERAFRDAVQKRTGSHPVGGHQLAAGGLWILKLALDRAKTDELNKLRDAAMSLDLPVGSSVNGWGVKFAESGQNANERVQHYMLQWQNGELLTVWPEEFTVKRPKWIPLPPWDQRK
ncbi:MAG: ABC transporter substrate-binding protein [Candidatus Rokubacteria bacterium]|nr:ABC transporter substrate-binding protein [Candidatus Rokubacteria bacterium]